MFYIIICKCVVVSTKNALELICIIFSNKKRKKEIGVCASYSNRTFWISFCVPGIKYKHRQIKNLVHNTLVGIFFRKKRERKIEREICEILENWWEGMSFGKCQVAQIHHALKCKCHSWWKWCRITIELIHV